MPRKEEFRPTIALNNEPPNTPATPPLKENSSLKRKEIFFLEREKEFLFLYG